MTIIIIIMSQQKICGNDFGESSTFVEKALVPVYTRFLSPFLVDLLVLQFVGCIFYRRVRQLQVTPPVNKQQNTKTFTIKPIVCSRISSFPIEH